MILPKRLEIVILLEGVVEPSGNTVQVLSQIWNILLVPILIWFNVLNPGENLLPTGGNHVGPPLQKLCQFREEWGIQTNIHK